MKKRLLAAVMSLCVIVSLLPVSVLAAGEHQHNIADGNVEIDASCGNDCPGHIITGSSTGGLFNGAHKIVVDGGQHTIQLNGITIDEPGSGSAIDVTGRAEVVLLLEGDNTLVAEENIIGESEYPGIWVEDGSSLTIRGSGTLNVTGGNGGPGIQGDVTIESGTIMADGGYGLSGDITITGGNVTDNGGGIGGSSLTVSDDAVVNTNGIDSNSVEISGGSVETDGIDADTIEISGGRVTSNGTITATTIKISDGNVTATGNGSNPGIDGTSITISGGEVVATGDRSGIFSGAGIHVGDGSTLHITGGTVTATGGGGTGTGAAGIGGNYNENFGTVVIEDGEITATGNGGGAGIGGGYMVGSGTVSGNVTITGGYVKALGGSTALDASAGAGIGAGENGSYAGAVTINGGLVYAQSGKENMPGIGGGGSIGAVDISHGTFQTTYDGQDGNAVIVVPHGIGANQNASEWDGIFVSYKSDENSATMDRNGNVTLNDSDANIQVWGEPVLDYDLTVDSGTTLRITANDRNKKSATLTMENGSTLTNDGTIELGTSSIPGVAADTSYLILKGGKDDTAGKGRLDVTAPAAVKLPLTKELVTFAPESPVKYSGEEQKPSVTVKLKNLWEYDQEFIEGQDYTQDSPQGKVKNAGRYTYTLKSTGKGNLLGTDEVEVNYTIDRADLTVTMPQNWTIWEQELEPLSKLPTPTSVISQSARGYEGEITDGTITWYSDERCTTELKVEDLNDNATIYWVYTHTNRNFESGQTGEMEIDVSDTQPPTVDFGALGSSVTKTYGDPSFDLKAGLTQGGQSIAINSRVTWSSSDEGVATITASGTNQETATVSIHSVTSGTPVTITATVAPYQGIGADDGYPQVTGTFTLTVNPKEVLVDESSLMLNEKTLQAEKYTWEYDGQKTVPATGAKIADGGLVSGDESDVTLTAKAVLNSADVGDRTATITYGLTGDKAKNYTLKPQTTRKSVSITKATPGSSVTPKDGTLTITNNLAKTYFFDLRELLPENATLGSVSYSGMTFTPDSKNSAYTGQITTGRVAEHILRVRVAQVNTDVPGEIGTITVIIESQNYENMTATITLIAENLEQGHSTGDITIKNVLAGNNTSPSDVFEYTLELKSEEIGTDTETPITNPVAYRGADTVTNGSDGLVTPSSDGTITFTLKGGEYLTFSGNLDQAHKVNYTITQTTVGGYTTTVTKAGDHNNSPQQVTNPVSGYLHCEHTGQQTGTVTNEWAEIVFTNTKNAGTSSLIYDTNGGKNDGPAKVENVAAGTYPLDSTTIPTHAPKSGVDVLFMGWLEKANSQTIYEEDDPIPELITEVELKDNTTTTVYAAWGYDRDGNGIPDALEVTLTYRANGGSGANQVAVYRTGTEVTVSRNSWFTHSGYSFTGWNTQANGGGTAYAAGSTITLTGDVNLYAQWSSNGSSNPGTGSDNDNDYTLYYHSNFGSDRTFYQSDDSSRMEVRDYGDMSFLPDREGYRFTGWNTEADGSGEDYAPGDTFRLTRSTDHLYAQWELTLADPDDTGVSRWLSVTDHIAYLTGYPSGGFGPDNSMTRAEVAQMFYALLQNKDVPITRTFPDVPADAWYATAVNTLASLGMVSGDETGNYRPNDPITRAEFCVIALAFAYEPENTLCWFTDVNTGDWFYSYVAQAASYGWIGGYTDGTFGPNNPITRAQVTTIVNNMLGRAADRDYVLDHQEDLVQFNDLTRGHWAFFQIMEATNAHDYTIRRGEENWR